MQDRTIKLYNFIKDFWYLIKLFIEIPPNDDQESWGDMIAQASRLNKQYSSDDAEGQFIRDCIQAWLNYLNVRNKESMRRNK